MQAVIDIGNSRIKAARFSGRELVSSSAWARSEVDAVEAFFEQEEWERWICSSVSDMPATLNKWISEKPGLLLSHLTPLPFSSEYTTPETLGNDRRALVAGALATYRGDPILVIDCGTCITYDLIDERGVHLGGAISPGPELRFRAMNAFTARLPLVQRKAGTGLAGKSTEDALRSGGFYGCITEFEGFIERWRERFEDLIVILSGGDAEGFADLTKTQIFVRPDLALHGLNEILLHNAE